MGEKKRLANLDLMKFMAVLMVIALHTPLFGFDFIAIPTLENYLLFFLRLVSEAVPVFLLVNGYLLFSREKIDYKKHYLSILKLLLLYVFWGTLYILFSKYIDGILGYFTFKELFDLLTEDTSISIYISQLGFVLGLATIYLLYPLLWKLFKNKLKTFVIIFMVITFITVTIDSLDLLRVYLNESGISCGLLYSIRNLVADYKPWWYLIYFMLGGLVYKYEDLIKRKKLIIIVLGAIATLLSFGYGYIISVKLGYICDYTFNKESVFMLFMVVALFALTINYKDKGSILNKIVLCISNNSFGIYLINVLAVMFTNHYLNTPFRYNQYELFCFNFCFSFVGSLIMSKIPIIKSLIVPKFIYLFKK